MILGCEKWEEEDGGPGQLEYPWVFHSSPLLPRQGPLGFQQFSTPPEDSRWRSQVFAVCWDSPDPRVLADSQSQIPEGKHTDAFCGRIRSVV